MNDSPKRATNDMLDSSTKDDALCEEDQRGTGGDEPAAVESKDDSVDALQARIAELEEELDQANDAALRARAELENVRRRMQRTMEEERKFYPLPFARDLLDVLDDLHRAQEMAEQSPEGKAFSAGLKMVADRFEEVLRKHHCLPIEAHGQPFDPHLHEAIGEHPTHDLPEGTVSHVARIGFKLHDRVIRPAQVLVSKRPEEPPSAANDDSSETTTSTDEKEPQ